MKITFKCPICLKEENRNGKTSSLCNNCGCLINLKAKTYDYTDEGGQNIPDIKKHHSRLENCKLRFKIIKKFINNNQLFVDIGTGSGEMIIASKKFFKKSLGFEHSKKLVNFYIENQIEVYNSDFDFEKIRPFLKKDTTILYSFNHVLEHNFNPLKLINNTISNHNKVVIYIEVPLYTGLSFKDQGENWKLWYDQHNALYSMNTLKFISKKLDMQILDHGFRTFISDSYSTKKNIFLFIKYPIRFIKTCLMYPFNRKNTFMDIFLKDYGYVIISKENNQNTF
tara:strand:+ start:402 stop:1247 length:846 start_codon:yes stop_codon:yes gene_type:complete